MEQVPIAEPKPMFRLGKDEYEGLHQRYSTLLAHSERQAHLANDIKDEIHQKLSSLFKGMMKALFNEKGSSLRIDILAEKPAQDFINAHAEVLDSGFKQVPMSDVMRQRLQRSDYIFSGIKTFHELNEAFPSLLDENGNRKPFERFLNDVQKIDQTYNQNYLRAEYNFVQASASMAAKWEKFAEDGDRYNLQYRTANDDKVRPEQSRSPSLTPSGSPTTRPTAGTAAAPSYRYASPSTQRHPTKRQCPSESRPPAMTQRVSSTSTQVRSRRPSPTTTPTPSAAAVTVTLQKGN